MCHPITSAAILLQLLLLHLTEGFLVVKKLWQQPQLPSQQPHLHQLLFPWSTTASTAVHHRNQQIPSQGWNIYPTSVGGLHAGSTNQDLIDFFNQIGMNEERSVYLSKCFPSMIKSSDLLDYYDELEKDEFYEELETELKVSNRLDRISIFKAIKRYGTLKFEFMVHCSIMYETILYCRFISYTFMNLFICIKLFKTHLVVHFRSPDTLK